MDVTKINIMHGTNPMKNQRERSFSVECRNAFEYLLASDSLDKEKAFYQEDIEAKKMMDEFFMYNVPRRMAFVGGAGSGKTSFLQHYFSIDTNNYYCFKDNSLYFYHSDKGNGIIEEGKSMQSLIHEMHSLCAYIENEEKISLHERNCKAFYDFVVQTKKNVLDNPWLKNEESSAYWAEVQKLKDKKKLSFYLMKLKYYLLYNLKNIRKIVLIFDDIESSNSYRELNKRVYQCMCNYDSDIYDGYQVKTVYTMCEKVYWAINGPEMEERFDVVVKKRRLMDPTKLFELRYQKAIEHGEGWMQQKGFGSVDLEFAHKQLTDLNKKFNGKYMTMILQISQYKKEDIMHCYRKILFNQVWIQKESFHYSSDSYITNEGFLFTNITCIRALACGNNQVYENSEESLANLIPNILYNTPEEDLSIHCLLLIKYFVRNNPQEEVGHKANDFEQLLKNIFGTECGMFEYALQYLIRKDIITASENFLSINSKGAELWDMLQGDSVLFEICREDYYRPKNTQHNMEPSYKLIDSMRQYVIFEDLLQMIMEFADEEDRLYNIISEREKWAEYEQYFGKRRMTFYLLVGVTKSIEYSDCRFKQSLNKLRAEAEQRVNTQYKPS